MTKSFAIKECIANNILFNLREVSWMFCEVYTMVLIAFKNFDKIISDCRHCVAKLRKNEDFVQDKQKFNLRIRTI